VRALTNRRILLGVTGGIACYKAALLARQLTQLGAIVDVVMTRSAAKFVGATTFQALTGREVHSQLFGTNPLDHIRLAQRAELILVAPATADFMARAAQGRADDLLSAAVLAARSTVLLAPAMNDHMWAKPATQRNVEQLRADGFVVVDPGTGPLAAGEGEGPGRMAEPDALLAHAARVLTPSSPLNGKVVLVSAGATREPLDPVRFISNHSSGKMGVALASAAWRRGAKVTLVAGHMSVAPPPDVAVASAATTDEMADVVRNLLPASDVLIMAAAPADFRPGTAAPQKIDKRSAPDSIGLVPTVDILRSTASARSGRCVTVGFALETHDVRERALHKLIEKNLDMIVMNDATEPGAGFAVDTNRVSIIHAGGRQLDVPLLPKEDVAEIVLDHVEEIIVARR
jgi:phosphopantothenoylcysteine decarboxylase/phosphopantothenate--cysteine ligase